VAEAAAPSVALAPRAASVDKPFPVPPAPAPLPPGSAETALLLLSLCYLHASACGYALPALLPDVAADLALSDPQAASLTFAFTLTYSLLLIPAGAAADVIDRPKLLAAGATAGGAHPDGWQGFGR
jgi:MFS family permease